MLHCLERLTVFVRKAILIIGLSVICSSGSVLAEEIKVPASEQAESDTIPNQASRFTFSGWAGPQLRVWTFVPEQIDRQNAPILFVMHGALRDPKRYRDQWIEEAKKGGFIIIAPEFSSKDFPGSRNYNLGAMFEGKSGELREQASWSFSVIEPLFDEVVRRLNGEQTHYTLYGHSAGSQFVHRYLFMKPDSRAKRYLAANAGWYTYADLAIEFPFGLSGTPATQGTLREALAKDVVILLGDQDIDAQHESLNRSARAMMQGPHRFARGEAFFAAAKRLAEANKWDFGWSLRVIPGVAHSNEGIAAGAYDLVE
jgi:alpha-beta hydrolase superfamily lysophospholipase